MVPTRLRANAVVLACALISVPVMGWLGLYGFAWTDYDNEAAPAFAALTAGHLLEFARLLPAYGGSMVLRAPFALLPSVWGGGSLAVYRAVAVPCLAAASLFAIWLVPQMRALGLSRLARVVAVGLCVANPLTLRALELGHPEELLGAVLCVAAILAATRARPMLAGVLLGAAIANKPWAVLAVGPVLLALPGLREAFRSALVAGVIAALVLVPPALVAGGAFATMTHAVATQTGVIFQPWQLWWFLGHHAGPVVGLYGNVKLGYRTPPTWVSPLAHPLIVALAVPLTLLCLRRPSWERDPLLLAALLFALRAALDPWDTIYYLLPFTFALLCWETFVRREAAVFTLVAVSGSWIVFQWAPERLGADEQALLFLLCALPAIVLLAVRLYAPALLRRGAREPAALAGVT